MANAISATVFIDTLGVNTHIGDAGAYSDTSMVEQNLEYLGVTIVRDSVDSASEAAVWQQVAQATGVKFDDYMPEGAPAWDQSALALVPQMAQEGILHSIEGGNEEDDFYAQANGNTLAWTAQSQQQVYAMGQQEGLPVINMSFGSGWTAANNWEGDYPNVGNLSAYTNYANAHTYPNVGQTPGSAIQQLNTDALLAASTRPVITTEIGWQTSHTPRLRSRKTWWMPPSTVSPMATPACGSMGCMTTAPAIGGCSTPMALRARRRPRSTT